MKCPSKTFLPGGGGKSMLVCSAVVRASSRVKASEHRRAPSSTCFFSSPCQSQRDNGLGPGNISLSPVAVQSSHAMVADVLLAIQVVGQYSRGIQKGTLLQAVCRANRASASWKVKESRGGTAIVGTAADKNGKLGPGLGSVLSLLKDRGELNKPVEWGGRANDSRNSFFTNSMGGYKDVFTGGRTDNDLAANVEAALTRKDEFGRTMTPKEAFRQFCHSFHGIEPSINSKEKRIRQAKRELDQKRKDSGATGERKLEKLQNASKTPFISLDGRKVKPGQQR